MENEFNFEQENIKQVPKFDSQASNFQKQPNNESIPTHIKIDIVDIQRKGNIINQYISYVIQGQDKLGQFSTRRRYSQFFALRECLINNWPGLYIPYLPEKILLQKNSMGVILYRERFLRSFLKKIRKLQKIYYSKEFQIFLREKDQNVCQKLKHKQTIEQIIIKYKTVFHEIQSKNNIRMEEAMISQFKMQLGCLLGCLPNLKEKVKKLVKSKSELNKRLSKFYEDFFFRYQKVSTSRYLLGKNEDLIFFNKNDNKLAQKGLEIKHSLQQNSLWLIYDLIDYETSDYIAFMDSLNYKQKLIEEQSKIANQIGKKLNESSHNSKGEISFQSLLSMIKQEQFNKKMQEQMKKLNKQQSEISQLNILISQILSQFEITRFRQQKIKFYYRAFRQFEDYQINIIQKFMQYWKISQDHAARNILKYKQWNIL